LSVSRADTRETHSLAPGVAARAGFRRPDRGSQVRTRLAGGGNRIRPSVPRKAPGVVSMSVLVRANFSVGGDSSCKVLPSRPSRGTSFEHPRSSFWLLAFLLVRRASSEGRGGTSMWSLMRCLRVCAIAAAILAAFLVSTGVQANESAVERGRAFAQSNCARCHAIGPVGQSPLPKAPPFRTFHKCYPVKHLGESLAEGIRTGHPAMPEFALDENQIRDLISYLKSLER
jgi:mono/diheme cytochrome c family protein